MTRPHKSCAGAVKGTVLRAGPILLAVVLGCGPPPLPNQASCAEPPPLTQNPTGLTVQGVRAGPLFFASGHWIARTRSELTWAQGDLPKFIVQAVASFETPLTIRGRHCESGKPLRFFFGGGSPWTFGPDFTPVPLPVIERTGTDQIEMPAHPASSFARELPVRVEAGYLLFPTRGRWAIDIHSDDTVIGTFSIELN